MLATFRLPQAAPVQQHERRVFRRTEASGPVEIRRLDNSLLALREQRLRMTMRDISIGGLSALSDLPIEVGERVSIAFPAQGLKRAWGALGRVLRCNPSPTGWHVAVEFDALPAA